MPKLGESLAINIKAQRIKKGFSQDALAKLIGKSRQTVVNYESGREGIDIKTISKFAEAFGCDETDLTRDPNQQTIESVAKALTKAQAPQWSPKRRAIEDLLEQLDEKAMDVVISAIKSYQNQQGPKGSGKNLSKPHAKSD